MNPALEPRGLTPLTWLRPRTPGRRHSARRPLKLGTRRSGRLALTAVVVLSGLGAAWRLAPRDVGAAATAPYLTVFLLDGLSEAVFQRELVAGRLPHMAELASRGAFVEHGISAFPSMTASGFHPFLTGQDAARSGVLGLRWFDRSRASGNLRSYVGLTQDLIDADRAPLPATLYERFGDQHTWSVNTYANRGVRQDERVGWSFAMAKYRDAWGPARVLAAVPLLGGALAPDWRTAEHRAVQAAIDDLARWPKIQWITFGSLDGHQHIHGTDAGYAAVLRALDGEIGRYREESVRRGQEPYRIYALLSDHGVAEAKANFDLRAVLESCCGLRAVRDQATRFRPSSLSVPLSEYDGADALVVVNGNMLNYVYVRDPVAPAGREWGRPLAAGKLSAYGPRRVDLIAGLRRAPGIELVIVRGDAPGHVHVHGAAGRGELVSDGRTIAYRSEGSDPLGYAALGLADGTPRTPAEWLAATHGSGFPDAAHRLVALMANENAGDIVVTSAAGHDLGAGYEMLVGSYRGGHGGLRADQLRVPYVLAGPGVVAGTRLATARAEDVGVTLMALLGLVPESTADGRLLREALAPAASR